MIKLLAGATGLWLSLAVAHAAELPPFSSDLSSGGRASFADIGCRMEKLFGRRDASFDCDMKNDVSTGDPCENATAYDEGPTFPKELAVRVHPLATEVHLSFEHGALQGIFVRLGGDFSAHQVRQALGRPAFADRGGNIMSIHIQPAAAGKPDPKTGLPILGFDHMGAGDVDCPDLDVEPTSP
jgi:hypothetical protein